MQKVDFSRKRAATTKEIFRLFQLNHCNITIILDSFVYYNIKIKAAFFRNTDALFFIHIDIERFNNLIRFDNVFFTRTNRKFKCSDFLIGSP